MITEKNLIEAFSGESQANRKYSFFSKKAKKEGYNSVAKLFKAASMAESIHAYNHLEALNDIKFTEENLKEAINGETYEFTKMYPSFIDKAKEENKEKALLSFEKAIEAEKIHAKLFSDILLNLDKREEAEFYLCPVCGYIEKNNIPDICPICGTKGNAFIKVEL